MQNKCCEEVMIADAYLGKGEVAKAQEIIRNRSRCAQMDVCEDAPDCRAVLERVRRKHGLDGTGALRTVAFRS